MAMQSFYEDLIIDTPEKAELLLRLIEEADRRPPTKKKSDILERLAEGERLVDEGFLDHLLDDVPK